MHSLCSVLFGLKGINKVNIYKRITFMGMIIFSASAYAEVTINVPPTIDILVANGVKPQLSGGIFDSQKQFKLQDGLQQIVFRFEPYFAQGDDKIGVETDVDVLKFSAANTMLNFQLPKYRSPRDAEQHINNHQWSLTDPQGHAVNLIQDKIIKEGVQIGRNYYTETAIYNQSHKRASVPQFSPNILGGQAIPAATTTIAQPARTFTPKASASTAENMLHYWYEQADEQTRMRFKQFINKQ
jgi:uncharacterized protein YccT (UPF0319 family)